MKENAPLAEKNRSFLGGHQNSPWQPPLQVNQEARNTNHQFLSQIITYLLKSIFAI
jgi:hypothetical protein